MFIKLTFESNSFPGIDDVVYFFSIGVVEKKQFPVINEEKKLKKSGYKNSGTLFVKNFVTEKHASFVDFLQVRFVQI